MRYRLVTAAAYLATLAALAYSSDGDIPEWVVFVVIFVMPLAVGVVAGLWALPVPPVVVLLAVPAGYGSGELPIWFAMLFVAFVAVPEIIIGWGARWLVVRYAGRPGTR